MKILITGAGGFLGTWVFKLLNNEQYPNPAINNDFHNKKVRKTYVDSVRYVCSKTNQTHNQRR